MEYTLRAVENGWVLFVPPDALDASAPYGEFVFTNLLTAAIWLANRHGETILPGY